MAVEPSDNLFIGDLPPNLDESQLRSVFGAYGTIKNAKMLQPGTSGKLAALIQFASVDEAKWIVENVHGNIPQGLSEPVQVRFKNNAMKGKGKGDGPYGMDNGGKGWTPTWGGKDAGKGWGGKDGGGADSNDNLFIGELPGSMDEGQLTSVFGAYGQILSSRLLPPGSSGKRAALIKFASADEAKWIVENLNGNIPQGLTEPCSVSFKTSSKGGDKGGWGDAGGWGKGAQSVDGKGGKGKGGFGIKQLLDGIFASGAMPGGVKYENDDKTLFVGGLPSDTSDIDLFLMFSPFGAIAPKGVTAMPNADRTGCKGFGFVNFLDRMAAETAVATLNGTQMPDGTILKINIKQDPASGGCKGGGDAKGGKGSPW